MHLSDIILVKNIHAIPVINFICQIEMKLFHRNINEEGKMTHSKQLCSKLISLLLALAMILALMPAVSLTASAAGPKYVLTADTPLYSSDGWTWDGQTLHFFGSGTYEVNSDYFSIESTKYGGDAVIDISGSITVSFTKHTAYFIDSPSCPLNIKGAGKITASTDTNSNKLFVSGCNITYAGGAICTDSDIALFISYPNDFTMTKGYIDAPNAYIEANSHTISNSYVAINSFNGSDKNGVVINIDKSYVDTQSILETDKERGLSITLTKSVMSSSAESSELGAVNDKQKPRFAEVTESVVYFPNMDNASALLGISGNDALKKLRYSGVEVAVGGVVFCDQLIENVSRVYDDLSGAFISLSNVSAFEMNNKLTGGILISYKGQVITYNTNAEDATIVILSTNTIDDDSDKVGLLSDSSNDTFKSCTIVNRCVTEKSAKLRFVEAYVENCNIYTNTESRLTTSYNSLMYDIAQPNNYCVPNGEIIINDQGNNGGNRYANITSKYISGTFNSSSSLYLSPVICGNVCADIYKGDDVKFDGTDTYDVSIGKFVINGLSLFVNMTANAYEKQSDGTWEYLSIANEYTGSSDIPIYIGKPVFNVINNPTTYQDITTCKGYPASLDVELVFPYEDVLTATEFKLYKDNAEVDPETAGITAEVTGSRQKLTLNLTAGEDAAADRYTFTFSVNGQKIKGASGDYVAFTLTEYPFHTMEFGDDSSISWPYIDKDGNPQTFTGADYEKKIEADTWTWYGRSDRENGYGGSTLVLNDGFNFTTTADYGISKTKMTTFNIVVKGSCTVNAAVAAIYSGQNVILNINGADDNSTLSVNTGIVSDESLYISGVDIEANNVTSVIKASAQIKPLLQSDKETFLYDCKITANDRWEGKEVINAPELKITRGVTLDLPACTIGAGLTYIAELESVDNILNGTAALTVEGSPYGEDNGAGTLKWIDYGMGMKLSTKTLEFIGTASDLIISDDTISADGDYCLFSGKEYRLDLSGLIGVDISGCQIMKDTTSGYSVKSQLVDGTQYFIVIPGKKATDSTTNSTVTISDSNRFYGSSMSLKLDVTLGRVVKADKVGFYHQGSYGEYSDPTNCYTASAAYNGKPLELQGTYPDAYYLVPSGENIEVTLIPNDGFRFDMVAYGDNTSTAMLNPSQDGTYVVSTDGTDKKFILTISPTYDKQYCKADISVELRRSLANGEIEAITLKYPDGRVKTLDGTLDEFPAYVLRNNEVTVSITPLTKRVLSINGAEPEYDSRTGAYSAELNLGKDTEITAELEDSANLCTLTIWHYNLSSADAKFTVTPAPINSLGQYRVGTECEIFANITEDKFIRDAKFNGAAVEPYKQTDDGCYYKVTTAAGENKFEVTYVDLSKLTIAKPEHGSVEFSGRLDYGRSFTTLADGTQVYSIGTTDTVTLTITPDKGYRLKSVKLDGDRAPAVTAENGVCTFEMDQSVSWTFTAEFEEIPAGNATVTVKCGANGMVTPSTADYPIGTKVTLTVTPDAGYQVKSAKLDGKDVKLTDGKYTFTLTADCVFSAEFRKKSTGAGTGGHRYADAETNDPDPILNGKTMSWSEIASDLSKLEENSKVDIDLNGSAIIPAEVLKQIKDKKISANLNVTSYASWIIDGDRIKSDTAYADLSLPAGTSLLKGARGIAGYRFTTGGNNVDAKLRIKFKNEYAGKFANLYFIKDGGAEFISTAGIAEDGYVTLSGAAAKGEYVVMLCDYSDLPGDVNNDGVLNALDASAILNDIIGKTKCANALMADFNIDGHISAKDASAILIHIVS